MRSAVLGFLGLLLYGGVWLALQEQGERSAAGSPSAAPEQERAWACTFSIAAFDPERKEWGVAVASKYLAVGSVVPWAQAGVGAIATQSLINTTYGSEGLRLLAHGQTPAAVLQQLTEADKDKEFRQVGIVDGTGEVAHYTGKRCLAWAGARSGRYYTCQGNILTGPEVVQAMATAFEEAKGPLAWRLLTALAAAEKAGGDKRGKQSAAVLVVREKGGPNGYGDRAIDLRVDDHDRPVQELARILALRLRRP